MKGFRQFMISIYKSCQVVCSVKETGRWLGKKIDFAGAATLFKLSRFNANYNRLPINGGLIGKRGATNVIHVDAANRWQCVRRAALLIGIGITTLGLSSCGSGSAIDFGGLGNSTAQTADSQNKQTPIAFAPVIGAPQKISSELSTAMVSAVERKKIVVIKDTGSTKPTNATNTTAKANNSSQTSAKADVAGLQPDYTVRGYFVASPDKNGTKLSYIWDITDKGGKRAHRIKGEEVIAGKRSSDPWSIVDKAAIDKIAEKTASDLALWLPKQGNALTTASLPGKGQKTAGKPIKTAALSTSNKPVGSIKPQATSTSKVLAIVPAVKGAPGDGNSSLSNALKQQLNSKGIQIASAGNLPGTYKILGTVKMSKAVAGKQGINIEWNVVDPAGRKLGTVSQKNSIPQGSLNGAWGKTADAAASAASQGIIKLLPKAK